MKFARILTILLTLTVLSRVTLADSPPAFQPQSSSVLGTVRARTAMTYTQVITQQAGELAIRVLDEHYLNLVPNWGMFAKALLKSPRPVVAYTTVLWADQALRVTCWLDRANSDLPRGRLRVVMEVTEGTFGASSIPVGTVFAISEGQLVFQAGMVGLDTHVTVTPGILPDVLPTTLSMITQIVPDLWETGQPGRASAVYTFTSVQPPDGSAPLVSTVREGFPLE
jgi:hypothetical protein